MRPDLVRDETLADIFEATAARAPLRVALIEGDRQLTYRELDELAGRAAARLQDAGIGPGAIVGLWMPRGIDLLALQLAITKTGAAWLPFDADTPVDRIIACLDDASAAGIVGCEARLARLADSGVRTWAGDRLLVPSDRMPCPRATTRPEDRAYVIYTSGSTGKPKGVAISQRSICHFLRAENEVLGVRARDKVYQGFSVAFDMSFEEVWISYLVGATLWIPPREIAGDPDALPDALDAHGITVLHAVPTLLSLFARDIPTLRLVNVGGEACPPSLAERWARPGRRLFNSYGPTEATVTASIAELEPGAEVTIGRPLPNYGMLVAAPGGDAALRPAAPGETGELCIFGPGIAEGYLGRPELTAERFVANPCARGDLDLRLYRTGDLGFVDPEGRIHCLGRNDDQVKIRGFRVELGEIERALARDPHVGTATVILRSEDGVEQLVAFVVAKDPATPPAPAELRESLAAALPPYMVPGRFEVLAELPRLASGKIDRGSLRKLPLTDNGAKTCGSDEPANEAERALFAVLGKLFPGQPVRRTSDFFDDLGGHSLFAARLASALRSDARYATLTVRAIYEHRRVGRIADLMASMRPAVGDASPPWQVPPGWKRWLCGAAQAATLPLLVTLRMAQWLAPFFTYHVLTGDEGDSVALAALASLAVFLLATAFEFAVAIAGKWLVAGRLRPGTYPLWGITYFRWWLADRLVDAAPVYLLGGSPLYRGWLRALGANVGKDVTAGWMTIRAPDLVSIGDGASIGNGVSLENARVERGQLRLGRVDIGRDVYLGSYVVLEGDTAVGECGHVEGQTALGEGSRVAAKRIVGGSPARDRGEFDPGSLPPRPAAGTARRALEFACYLVGACVVAAIFFAPAFPSFMLIDHLDERATMLPLDEENGWLQLARYFVLALPASAVLIVLTVIAAVALRWAVLPRMASGSWPVHSPTFVAKWLVNQIQESSLAVLHGLYATLYAPLWYRLLGAKVGRGSEISTAVGFLPDMLTLGDDTFIADAVMLGDENVDGGWMRVRPTVVSRRSFVGNSAFVSDGTTIPPNTLVGVLSSVSPATPMAGGETWLGAPPIRLPAREVVGGFPESLTFRPSPWRRFARGAVEALRIVAPHALIIAVGYTVVLDIVPDGEAGRWGEVIVDLAVAGVLFGAASFVLVWALKWLLIGRYRRRAAPMWTPFVWLSEAVTSLYEGIAVPNFMRFLRGTPWLPVALRLMGCRIGRGVYIDTLDVTEFDCVRIGDHSELAGACGPQTHLFEDRVMKIDEVAIGERCYLGPRSIVLYGARVGDGARLGPLTLVMKGEAIPAGTSWAGCPAAAAHA